MKILRKSVLLWVLMILMMVSMLSTTPTLAEPTTTIKAVCLRGSGVSSGEVLGERLSNMTYGRFNGWFTEGNGKIHGVASLIIKSPNNTCIFLVMRATEGNLTEQHVNVTGISRVYVWQYGNLTKTTKTTNFNADKPSMNVTVTIDDVLDVMIPLQVFRFQEYDYDDD